MHTRPFFYFLLFSSLILASQAFAQAPHGALRGQVTDPSGAVVTQATVSATSSTGETRTAVTNSRGTYEITGLAADAYLVSTTAKGFAAFAQQDVAISGGQVRQLDVALELPVQQEQVVVQDETAHVDVSPSSDNAGTLVIKGQDLDALSDDPDELQSELEALAGPAAGPNGGQFYIDGFTGGQLPPKSAIREIRINQNPFSAEYDKIGYGRIEILTKPGTDQYHGEFRFNDDNSVLNSKNPFIPAERQPAYQSEIYDGSFSGSLSRKASFFLNLERRNINDTAIVDAANVPASFGSGQLGVPSPQTRTNITPRIDYQLGQNNTLTVRYQFTQTNQSNQGVGPLALASQGYNVNNTEQTLQVSDTQVLSPKAINETRFQYIRDRNQDSAQNASPAINVLGTFLAGGNTIGQASIRTDHYELQNYTSMSLGRHAVKFGGRLRSVRDADSTMANANGTFTFPGPTALNNNQPSQFAITVGQPVARLTLFDAALSAQDDWRIRPNMTLSYGLRFESQNHISDHADLAPRLGFAWGLGNGKTPPKTVLRAGFGLFYDRIPDSILLQAEQLNGVNQKEYIVPSPTFYPNVPSSLASLGGVQPTVYQIDPRLHAPYVVQTALSVERQLSKKATLSVTYLNSRGFDQLIARDINAPAPNSGVRPFGNAGNIYQYESQAVFKQNQLIANYRVSVGTRISLFGYYSLSYANSDTGTGGTNLSATAGSNSLSVGFPSNPYNLLADYGRAAFDVRQRVFLGGTLTMPYGLRLSPLILATSGHPFNITLPDDLNGDGIFNDRPAFCTSSSTNCTNTGTSYGSFDLTPAPGQTLIPVNYGTGPGQFTVNLRLAKTFALGRKLETANGGRAHSHGGYGGHGDGPPGGTLGPRGLTGPGGPPPGAGAPADRRYSLTFSVAARNLFNRVNAAPPIGVLTAPLFGMSNALAGGPFGTADASRRVAMQMMFSF